MPPHLNVDSPEFVTNALIFPGSAVTFRAYGVTCIFVLAGFFGTNYLLKRKGIPIDTRVPHEVLDEEQQVHMDPHGVPSGLARDLSSSKLNKEDGRCCP